jgi:hypothetical protein
MAVQGLHLLYLELLLHTLAVVVGVFIVALKLVG